MKIVENCGVRKLKKFENEYLEEGLLKVGTVTKKYMSTLSPEKGLLYLHQKMFSYSTYYVSDNKIQCRYYKRRSQGDFFRILKYYYPDITLKETRSLLFNAVNTGYLFTSVCNDIGKRVFYTFKWTETPYRFPTINCQYDPDELGLKLKISRK